MLLRKNTLIMVILIQIVPSVLIIEDARFNEFVRANYRNEYELARAMRDYIESVVSCKMTEEEVIYLAVQLKYADIKKKEGKKNGIF